MNNIPSISGTNNRIGENVQFGNNTIVGSDCIVGDNCVIGHNSIIEDGVILEDNVYIAENCVLRCGVQRALRRELLSFLVDVYVYNKEYGDKISKQYIDYECKKLSIIDFENNIRELAFAVLNGNKLSQKTRMLLDYMIFSGTYGTIQNSINNKLKNGNVSTLAKLNHIRKRIFVPVRKSDPQYKMYAARYKWFYKSKARIPLLIFYRIGIALTSRRSRVKAEFEAIVKKK